MDWNLFLTTFLGSGAALTLITVGFELYRHNQQRGDSAGFLALQIAFSLEAYASACADALSEDQTAIQSGESLGEYLKTIPAIPNLPESDAYKLLNRQLLHEIMELQQRRALAIQSANYEMQVVDDEAYHDAILKSTSLLAKSALSIAKRLRETHKQPKRELDFGAYNLSDYIDDTVKEFGGEE